MELNNLANKTALITGAGKGIGKALAIALAKEGTHLGLIARTQSDLEALKAELDGQYDVKVAIAAADVGLQAEVDHAVASIQEQLGPIHIVINNAGIASFGTLADMPVQEWERIIQVNLMGTYYVTRAMLPGLIAQNEGSIINISSTAGERGFATGSAYNASSSRSWA